MGIANRIINRIDSFIQDPIWTLCFVVAIALALSFHEFAHARVAYHYGDPTAKDAGRLTVNPLRHLDLVGTLMLIFMGFGWAKPVPVNAYYFEGDRRKKMMMVSLAGPASNLIQALVAAILYGLLFRFWPWGYTVVFQALRYFLFYYLNINIVLAVFNLLPVPPLDGSKILAGLLPERHMNVIFALERYGFIILILLLMFGVINLLISPIVSGLMNAFLGLSSLIM